MDGMLRTGTERDATIREAMDASSTLPRGIVVLAYRKTGANENRTGNRPPDIVGIRGAQ
jgi:hypothetical protein